MENNNDKAFEKAAKYISTAKFGLCPMIVEKFPCPKTCDEETMAWQCWMIFFRSRTVQDEYY
jgi:hypothetical protein